MAEDIGLSGKFELDQFDSGIAKYNKAVGDAVSATNKAASSFGQSWNSMGSTVLKATGIMATGVAAGVAALGAAVVGVGAAAFSASADFEASTKKMTSQLGLTADEAKVFDETMRSVFANNFGESIDDVAASLVAVEEQFGRIGGTEGAGELQFATEAALALRDAFGVEVTESTNAAVELMDQFGISSEQAFDLLTAGFQTGLNSSDDFLDTIGEYSTQFANGGASVEEFFGLMRTGLQGGMLGTDKAADAFKEFQVRILDGSTATADALGMLGFNADEFTSKIASGEMTVSEAFTKITQKFHTVEDQAVLMQAGVGLLGTQFEDLGVDGVLALNMLDTSFADVSGRTASLNTQYETFGQAVSGMWRRLIVAMTPFTDMILDLVNMAMPHVMKAFDAFEDSLSVVIEAVGAAIKAFDSFIKTGEGLDAAEFGLTGTTAELANTIINFGFALYDLGSGAFAFVQEHAEIFKGALMGIGAVLAAAGLAAGISALAAAIASLFTPMGLIILAAAGLGIAWNTNFLGIRDTTLAVIDTIKTAFEPLTTAISEFGSGALAEITAFVTGNETEFTNLKAIWAGAQESFSNAFTLIQEASTGLLDYLKEQFPALTPVFDGFAAAIALVASQVGSQFTLLQDATSSLVSIVTSLIAGDWAGAWQSAQDLAGAFDTYVRDTFSALSTFFTDTFGEFGPVVTGAFTEIQTFVTGNETEFTNLKTIWTGAKTSFDTAFNPISEWFTDNWPAIKTTLEEWGVDTGALQEAWDTFSSAFSTAIDTVKTAWQTLVDLFTPTFEKLGESISTFQEDMSGLGTKFTELKDAFNEALTALGEAFTKVWDLIKPILTALGTAIGVTLGVVAIFAINLLASTFESMGDIVGIVVDQVILVIDSISETITTVVDLVTALVNGDWKTAWDEFKNLATTGIDLVTGTIDNLLTLVGTVGTTIYDAIVGTLEDLGLQGVKDKAAKIWQNVVDSAKEIFGLGEGDAASASSVFTTVGGAIIQGVIDGAGGLLEDAKKKIGEIKDGMIEAFSGTEALKSWLGTGKAIIDGVLKGLQENGQAIIDYIFGLGKGALDSIKGLFGIDSPSKVMAEIGRNIIEGWIDGMEQMETRLQRVTARMVNNFTQAIINGADNAMSAFAGLSGSFSSAGSGLVAMLQNSIDLLAPQIELLRSIGDPFGTLAGMVERSRSLSQTVSRFDVNKRNLDFLKQQADLIDLIRQSGGDPAQILAGVTLGVNADPQQLTEIITRTMGSLNAQLESSIRVGASSIGKWVEELRANRKSLEEIEAQFAADNFDQRERFLREITIIDGQIAAAERRLLATGDMSHLAAIHRLQTQRDQMAGSLQTYLTQTAKLQEVMSNIKNLAGPGQTSAERFVQEYIQPIVDAFNKPMREVDRAAWLKTAEDRVKAVNLFVDQMRALEKLQGRVAGNPAFDHLADEFAMVADINIPEANRIRLIGQMDSYITQMMRLHDIQQDIAQGRSVNPIADRFATERLDTIARQLENINLTEAERNRLIEQYRIEQEKVLEIQRKQQQLDIINQQLDLINQLRDLDNQEGWSINVEDILAGIQFGVNASIDDLMRLTSRVLDELVRFANHELGIASPSKVFATVGENIMAGLARGIEASIRQPMSALRGAASDLIPYSLGQRTLAVNMGGVTINNMMDDVMFEARIRQIVRSEFAT